MYAILSCSLACGGGGRGKEDEGINLEYFNLF